MYLCTYGCKSSVCVGCTDFPGSLGWRCRMHQLHFCRGEGRGKTSPTSVIWPGRQGQQNTLTTSFFIGTKTLPTPNSVLDITITNLMARLQ